MESAIASGCCGLYAIFYMMFWFSMVGLSLALLVFKIMMIIDCARKQFPNPNDMIVWILVIIFAPFGSIIYYFVIKRNDPESPIMPIMGA